MGKLLSDTINFCVPFCRYMAANIGTSNQPALEIACIVRNIMLSAPFTWRWNRKVATTFLTVIGTQDYAQTITDFGFLETATLTDATGKIFQIKDIKNTGVLGVSGDKQRPNSICVLTDTLAGSPPLPSVVFRFMGVPDAVYTVTLTYMMSPVQFTSTSGAWAPIPDCFSDIFNNLFLGYYMESCQDTRGGQFIARGGAALLAKAEGLSEMDRAIFMQAFLNLDAAQVVNQMSAQQGRQAIGQK
jgi:hypothetical protein